MNLRKQLSSYIALNNYVEAIRENTSSIVLTDAITNGLTGLQLKGGTEQRNLPEEYTQLEYLKATGTQFINTGISGGDDDLVIDIVCKYSAWVQYGAIFGNWIQDGYNTTRIITDRVDSDKLLFNCNNFSGSGSTLADAPKNTRLHIVLQKGSVTINGVTTTILSDTGTANNSVIALFNRNIDNPANRNIELEVESYSVSKNNVVIQNLIPCRRKSDGVLGMYDLCGSICPLTGTPFYINAGTGEFIAGAEAVPTPDTPVDIVCNNGVLKVGSDNSVIVKGTPETVTITGKNLLDINKTSGAGYLDTSGELVPFDNYYCSDYIEIKPSTVYTYTETMKSAEFGNYIRFCFYDSNKTFIPPRQGDIPTSEAKTYTYKITSPVNAKYIRISSHSNFVKGQLEEGIRPTKYEEYYQASFAPEDLLKLGDYQDVQSVLDGIVTRNIGIKVLDGTENWTRYEAGKFATPLIGSKKQDNQQAPISTHFIGKSYDNVPAEDGSMAVFNGSISSTSGTLGINYQATPEVEQFKQWLADQYAAGTPVIVVYPLADTVKETVESRDVFITSGTNTIERNSEYVSSDGITIGYKKLR